MKRKRRLRHCSWEGKAVVSCRGSPAGADTSKDDCCVVFKVALSGFLKDAKSVYLTKGLQPMKKNAVHKAFFSLSWLFFCATSIFFTMFSFYFENYDYRYLFTAFFFQNSLFILNLDVLCKKYLLWGKCLKKHMHIHTVHRYVQMYMCIKVFRDICINWRENNIDQRPKYLREI